MIILTEEEKRRLMAEAAESGDVFDEEELYHNCTVQVWRSSKTGRVSIGWWRNGIREMMM